MSYSIGPWKIEYDGGDRHLRSADGDSLMCETQYYPWTPRKDEDWNLIASTPELFEALTEVMKFVNRPYSYKDRVRAFAMARAALAKAEGKQA